MARRSDEAQAFFHAVYRAVQEIPYGKVTSYGHIAKLIGTPQRPRQVGICLKHLPSDPAARFHHDNVPWQRVISAKGVISPRSQPSGSQNQAAALRAEGVTVTNGALGELQVDFAEFGWFPTFLPSEDGEEEEEEEEEEDEDEDEDEEDESEEDGEGSDDSGDGGEQDTGERGGGGSSRRAR